MQHLFHSSIPRINRSSLTSKSLSTGISPVLNFETEIIGAESGFWGPLGWMKYTYVDNTASGKSVKCIENFLQREVLPHYANTHTTISNTSFQTTTMRNEARDIIRQSVGAVGEDEIIFCGSGATSAVHKILHSISYPKSRELIVFVGPFEHHSNILPWREAAAKIIEVPVDLLTNQIDTSFLRSKLKKLMKWSNRIKSHFIIGCFSAGSNVTGALTDDVEITQLMHKYGGLAVWDYAAAAPHVEIDMNPKDRHGNLIANAMKDAIFFSGHKFLGGPQTPGVLVIKRHMLQNPAPHGMGGGTVLFTTRKGHQYYKEVSEREEGGTPDIIGSIRLGLVFRLRNIVGIREIVERESELCMKAIDIWNHIPEVQILGSSRNPRLPIVSFMIQHKTTGYFLHHNFVVALLNDFFGIQCRGGCMCAGPYAQVLLNLDEKITDFYASELQKTQTIDSTTAKQLGTVLKPGFIRIAFNFHMSDEELNFVIDAVKLIALYGWRLLPFYRICWEAGCFKLLKNIQNFESAHTKSLTTFDQSITSAKPPKSENEDPSLFNYAKCIKAVERIMKSTSESGLLFDVSILSELEANRLYFEVSDNYMNMRWFMLPSEAMRLLYEEEIYLKEGNCSELNGIKSSEPFKPLKGGDYASEANIFKSGSIPSKLGYVWHKSRYNRFENSKMTYFGSSYWENVHECDQNPLPCSSISEANSVSSGFKEDL